MSGHLISRAGFALVVAALAHSGARAQSAADFFRGQTLRVVIPSAPGGGRVFYTLPFVEFFGRHLPGKPNVQPVFMPGAGGSIGMNYAYNVAPRDGLTIVTPLAAVASAQAIGEESVKYDVSKMHWIGRTADATRVLFSWNATGIASLEDLRARETIIGSAGRASETFSNPAIMNRFLGTKFRIVIGYKAAGDVNQAVEKRETDAATTTWSGLSNLHGDWFRDGKARVLFQIALTKLHDLPDVPLLVDQAADDLGRQVIAFMSSGADIGEGFATPPGVPPHIVEALRRAFDETMRDPEFLANAAKLNMHVNSITGEEMTRIVNGVVGAPKTVIDAYMSAINAP